MSKENAIIFGAAGTGQKIYKKIKDQCNIVYFSDNNQNLWGTQIDDVQVIPPMEIEKKEYDCIYIGSMCGIEQIMQQLLDLGIPRYKIIRDDAFVQTKSRILFLERCAELIYDKKIRGSVAEAGVYRGEFAKHINKLFADRELYLFDTFSGFVREDINEEQQKSMVEADYLKNTSVQVVLDKMKNKEKCIVCKGFFPDTAKDVHDTFCFVSLDMDLYKPTLEGLRFFYPKMETGGIIALHDYFSEAYPNIRDAVNDFQKETNEELRLCPVGDDISIAIIK